MAQNKLEGIMSEQTVLSGARKPKPVSDRKDDEFDLGDFDDAVALNKINEESGRLSRRILSWLGGLSLPGRLAVVAFAGIILFAIFWTPSLEKDEGVSGVYLNLESGHQTSLWRATVASSLSGADLLAYNWGTRSLRKDENMSKRAGGFDRVRIMPQPHSILLAILNEFYDFRCGKGATSVKLKGDRAATGSQIVYVCVRRFGGIKSYSLNSSN